MIKLKSLFYRMSLLQQFIVLMLSLVFTFGLIGPSMISSNSTIAVWIGIAICVCVGYLAWTLSGKLRELI